MHKQWLNRNSDEVVPKSDILEYQPIKAGRRPNYRQHKLQSSDKIINLGTGSDIKKLKTIYFIAALVFFFGGITIYAFFRNLNMVLFRFFPKPLFLDTLFIPVKTDSVLMRLFLFNLPDGLWFLSGLLLIRALWLENALWGMVYRGIFCAVALLIELTQSFENIPGTFDLLDLLFMGIFAFLESIIFNSLAKRSLV